MIAVITTHVWKNDSHKVIVSSLLTSLCRKTGMQQNKNVQKEAYGGVYNIYGVIYIS